MANSGKKRKVVFFGGCDLVFYRHEYESFVSKAADRVARHVGGKNAIAYSVREDSRSNSETCYQVQIAIPCKTGGATPIKQVYLYL